MHSDQGKGSDHYSMFPLFHELVRRGLADSYGDARRLVRSGRVSVNKGMVSDETMIVTNLTEINVAMDAGHRTFSIPEGSATRGGQPVDPLELAEEVISAFCSDIRKICTTGYLTTDTFKKVADLLAMHRAMAEMMGDHRFGLSIDELAQDMESQGMKLPAQDFYSDRNVGFGISAEPIKEHADRLDFVKNMTDQPYEDFKNIEMPGLAEGVEKFIHGCLGGGGLKQRLERLSSSVARHGIEYSPRSADPKGQSRACGVYPSNYTPQEGRYHKSKGVAPEAVSTLQVFLQGSRAFLKIVRKAIRGIGK